MSWLMGDCEPYGGPRYLRWVDKLVLKLKMKFEVRRVKRLLERLEREDEEYRKDLGL